MPAAIQFEAEVSERSIADFVKALSDYQRKTQRDLRGALRSATIDLVKSLRKQTRKAPRLVPRSDVRWGEEKPKYYTGKKDGRLYRRVIVTRYAKGRPQRLVRWQEVETRYVHRRTANGGLSESWKEASAPMLRAAREKYGRIRQWGLAKKSWGWFMHALFQKATQDENPNAIIDKRMVDGGMKEQRERLPDGTIDLQAPIKCEIDIVNKLDYIRKAMPPGVLAVAVQKATNLIRHKAKDGLASRRFGK